MKLLGRGWQYSAYDLGNGRVLKKRNSKLTAYWCMLKDSWKVHPEDIWKFPRYYRNADSNILSSFEKIRMSDIDRKFLGNPRLPENGFEYEQDYVESVRKYLRRVSTEEGRSVIDRFVAFSKFLIDKRLMDKSFNMGANFGIESDGTLILVDIGELYSEPKNIQRQINERVWTEPYILDNIPVPLQDYFVKALDTHFPIA